ncbi:MAG: hypothetical protein VX899_13930 [Myxococcota bacterium]|nr:hypothetical protein [Myxococcota bacterium]
MLLLMFACTGAQVDLDDTQSGADDTADTQSEAVWPQGLAELTEPSDGACPDLSASGTTTFSSSGQERTVTALIPAGVSAESQVVFFFHGLMGESETPEPTEYMASALDLQSVADAYDAIILLPESMTRTEFNTTFFLWDVEGTSDADLVLFDDLRSCVHQAHAPDMTRLSAVGFSGGALFTTIVASQRGDSLSTFVEMSGGANFDVALLSDATVAAYETPAWQMPALLWAGGENDAWPSPSFALVDFDAGTDVLEQELAADGHLTVRCDHDQGHTITQPEWASVIDWINGHQFGESSPFDGDLSALPSTCGRVE